MTTASSAADTCGACARSGSTRLVHLLIEDLHVVVAVGERRPPGSIS